MKNYILYIAFTLGLVTVNAQDFQETKKYIAKSELATMQEASGKTKVQILVAEDVSQKVATIETSNLEVYQEVRISILEKPQLNQIEEVIKVEFEYSGYSLVTDTYYFLVTEKGDYIALPKIIKVYDDITEPIMDYVFPTQKHGQEETIIKAIFHYTHNYTKEEIEVLQKFVWNDDDFGSEDTLAGIEN